MKRLLSFAFCFCLLLGALKAMPADDVETAIAKLFNATNFSWTVTWDQADPASRFRYQGKTEVLGATAVVADRHGLRLPSIPNGDAPVAVVFVGERCVVRLDGAWLIPRELGPFAFLQNADSGLITGPRTYAQTAPGYVYLPRPDLILRVLRGQLEDVKSDGRVVTGDLTHKAAAQLFQLKLALPQTDAGAVRLEMGDQTRRIEEATRAPASRSVLSADNPLPGRLPPARGPLPSEHYVSPKGTVTFWLDRGALVKFELRLEAIGVWQPASQRREIPHDVLIAATIEDAGTSSVEVPAGAREKLSIP